MFFPDWAILAPQHHKLPVTTTQSSKVGDLHYHRSATQHTWNYTWTNDNYLLDVYEIRIIFFVHLDEARTILTISSFSCFLTPGTASRLAPGRWSCWPGPLPPPAEEGWSASAASPGDRWCGWVLHRFAEVWWHADHYACCLALSRPEHLP